MAVRTHHEINDNTWFVTSTCYNWLPLFEIIQGYDIIYNWLILVGNKYNIKTMGFVIMPNHVHLLLYICNDRVNLNAVIGNGKRFMAYEIVKRLSVSEHKILDKLSAACSSKEKAKGQHHKVFEPSFDGKPVYSLKFLHQKLDYIHNNPVSGKWNLCDDFVNYPHSSAAFYRTGFAHANVFISDYRGYWSDAWV